MLIDVVVRKEVIVLLDKVLISAAKYRVYNRICPSRVEFGTLAAHCKEGEQVY
jgi:hypothetical protein